MEVKQETPLHGINSMQKVDQHQIEGAEIKREDGGTLIVGFSSQKIRNEQLASLKAVKEDYFLAFYGCDFSKCNLALLAQIDVKQIGVFYSKFDDKDLNKIANSRSLELLKLHDTKVTPDFIKNMQELHPHLKIT